MSPSVEFFELGNVSLQSGEVLRDAGSATPPFGRLRPAQDNVVIFPTDYAGTHRDNARLIGRERRSIRSAGSSVGANLFGNGVSSSPSNHHAQRAADFPRVTIFNNARCQMRLLPERWGIERGRARDGVVRGAKQAYHLAALYPIG